MKDRQSNFELLRIIAMLAIVMGHFIEQSGYAQPGLMTAIMRSATHIAVNVFVLIGCWFLVDAQFKAERIVRLYLEVALYCIPVTILMTTLGLAGGARNVIQGLLPFWGRPVWFASAYISLLALAPFLNKVFELSSARLTRLVILLGLLFCGVSTMPQFTPSEYLADFAWFPVLYIAMGWAKRHDAFRYLGGIWVGLIGSLAIYLTLCLTLQTPLAPLAGYWLGNIRSLPNVACALLLFNAFRQMKLGVRRPINLLASSSFAVYILHQIPAIRPVEWGFFKSTALSPVLVALIIYAVACVVDRLRLAYLEPRYISSRFCKYLVAKINRFYGLE